MTKKFNGIAETSSSTDTTELEAEIDSNTSKLSTVESALNGKASLASNNTFTGTMQLDSTLTIGAGGGGDLDNKPLTTFFGSTNFKSGGNTNVATFDSKVFIKSYAQFLKDGLFDNEDVFDKLSNRNPSSWTPSWSALSLNASNAEDGGGIWQHVQFSHVRFGSAYQVFCRGLLNLTDSAQASMVSDSPTELLLATIPKDGSTSFAPLKQQSFIVQGHLTVKQARIDIRTDPSGSGGCQIYISTTSSSDVTHINLSQLLWWTN